MVNVFEPNNPLLKKYVLGIYIFERGADEVKYNSYPSVYTAVGLFRNTYLEYSDGHFTIKNSDCQNHFAIANRLLSQVHLHYREMVDEIAVNFGPLGFCTFSQCDFTGKDDFFMFPTWDEYLRQLFDAVFSTSDPMERLRIIEEFLLARYQRVSEEERLLGAVEILSDPSNDSKVEEVAAAAGVHYKHLYRSFVQYIGCSPVHFRKIVKFRRSVLAKLNQGDAARLVDICYDGDYTDQSYFIKQFQELTGENPKKFFKDVSAFGNNKVVFRFH